MRAHLELQFAITGRIHVRERRARGRQRLRISHTASGAKNSQKLVTLAADTAEQAEFLENHSPGNDGKEEQQSQDAAGNPTSLFKYAAEIGGEDCDQEK